MGVDVPTRLQRDAQGEADFGARMRLLEREVRFNGQNGVESPRLFDGCAGAETSSPEKKEEEQGTTSMQNGGEMSRSHAVGEPVAVPREGRSL